MFDYKYRDTHLAITGPGTFCEHMPDTHYLWLMEQTTLFVEIRGRLNMRGSRTSEAMRDLQRVMS